MQQIEQLLVNGHFAEAITLAQKLFSANVCDSRLIGLPRLIGDALFSVGLWEDAAPWLAIAAEIEPWDADLIDRQNRADLPEWLSPDRYDPVLKKTLRRYSPRESGSYSYIIDVVGTCNLRCPTCPVGNSLPRPKGFMTVELFTGILEKIRRECPDSNPRLALYNWGEPLLHPQLPEMITLAHNYGFTVALSTNLNIRKGLEEIVAAGPAELKISISGLTANSYAKTHRRGDLALVLANLRELRKLIDKHSVSTRVWIGHHVYRSTSHQVPEMAQIATELGFEHHPIDAFFMPLERLGEWLNGEKGADPDNIIPDLPLDPLARQHALRKQRNGDFDCELRFAQTVINHDGSLALCCGVYDSVNMLGEQFLDLNHEEIEARRYAHPFCKQCMAAEMHYAPPSLKC
jgi:pyruvate-formate lyase-activating enzyme